MSFIPIASFSRRRVTRTSSISSFHTVIAVFLLCSWIMVSIPCCHAIPDLDKLFSYLRHDDKRLVRYNVPSTEAASRQRRSCSKNLENLMDLLDSSSSTPIPLEERLKIVKIMTLCSSENPKLRQEIGTYKNSAVLKAIISILDEGDEAAAIAGESIWILSFNNEHNHNCFVDNGAILKMTKIIENRGADKEHHAVSAVMWAAAALQNLAASYCDTESGHCWWEYDTHNGLNLHYDSPSVIDGSKAAEEIVKSEEFVNKLKDLACRGGMSESDEMWPSLATIHDTMTPKLSTWAVAGLLKNLSLHKVSEHATYAAKHCLCLLAESEDWLESSKAEDALYRLGIGAEECWEGEEL